MRVLDAQICPALDADYSDSMPWVMGYLLSFGSHGHGIRKGLQFAVESAKGSGHLRCSAFRAGGQ